MIRIKVARAGLATILFVFLIRFCGVCVGGDSSGAWRQAAELPAAEAHQAAAADENYVYAITNSVVAKYDRKTGERIAGSTGAARHLNSGFFHDGQLLCAHSNYPNTPEQSEIKVLDVDSMELATFHDFGNFGGSLTWVLRHDDAWWCNFAHYGDENQKTFLGRFNDEWQETGRWTYPPAVIGRLGSYSLSGGIWRDDKLLVTGHDDRVIFRLELPASGDVLQFIDVQPAPFSGQGIAADPVTGGLIGIDRASRQIVFASPCEGAPFEAVACDGTYSKHLQGVCTNDCDAVYWSFTDALVKTDTDGQILKRIPVADHHGDLCHHAGRIYVAVNLGQFNQPAGRADSWVYVYDAESLDELARHETREVVHGAGGIACDGKRFIVVGGLPESIDENYLYEYDLSLEFQRRHILDSGHTHLGIQTAAFFDDVWWFGCYGTPKMLLKADAGLEFAGAYEFDCSLGITSLPDQRILVAKGPCGPQGCTGQLLEVARDDAAGLVFLPGTEVGLLQLTLPDEVFASVGVETAVYFDNIVLTETPDEYQFDVTCDLGAVEDQRWVLLPEVDDVGEHQLTITISDLTGDVLGQASTELHIVAADAGADEQIRLLLVGDSLTHASLWPNELARLLSQPGNPDWELLGTHRPDRAAENVAHEGYGGWTWQRFAAHYEPDPDGTHRKQSSPFVFLNDNDKPVLDVERYLSESCDGSPPDMVIFLLGINDCFSANPDDPAAIDIRIDAAFAHAEALLAAFRAAAPEAQLGVCLTTPPNARESGFEANYQGRYHRWGWKRIQHRLVQRELSRFGDREDELIYIVPTELNLDPMAGYPENNGVHPNMIGYAQIGASVFAWVKSRMAR